METITIHKAKTELSRLIEKACRGEEIVIARGKKPVVRLVADGQPIWLLGLADQIAFAEAGVADAAGRRGPANLAKTLAAITDDSPAILLAHEPDIFPEVPDRVALTLSGHTHGGQIRIAGWSPIVPSIYGNRYAYGHVKESIRHLIVSGGLGTSSLPVRLGVPPEIVIIEINAA